MNGYNGTVVLVVVVLVVVVVVECAMSVIYLSKTVTYQIVAYEG